MLIGHQGWKSTLEHADRNRRIRDPFVRWCGRAVVEEVIIIRGMVVLVVEYIFNHLQILLFHPRYLKYCLSK